MEPHIQYAKTKDGVSIACTTVGEGPPLVWVQSLNSHVQLEWQEPVYDRMYAPILTCRKLVRFDSRGTGLSDRGVDDLSLDALVLDVEAVVERLGLSRFALVGFGRGGMIAIAFRARHSELVSHLVLCDAFARGADLMAVPRQAALVDLAARDWEMYTETLGGVAYGWEREEARRYARFIRACVTQEDVVRVYEASSDYDVADLLAGIEIPTLVIRHTGVTNLSMEMAKHLASAIPNARLVLTEGKLGERDDVIGGAIVEFLSEGEEEIAGTPTPSGLVTILFTDMESSTALTQRLGDAQAQNLLRAHNTIVRDALKAHSGSEIKHTGDGIMVSFPSASGALECAIAIQRAVHAAHADPDSPLARPEGEGPGVRVRIGLNAGEPVAEDGDLFGTAVQLARRICDHAEPGQILASNVVRELSEGKGFLFGDIGDVVPKGFEQPVRLYEVRWRESD